MRSIVGNLRSGLSTGLGLTVLAAALALGAAATAGAATAADVSTRNLLEALEERQMPDMSLLVLDRVKVDKDGSPELKKEAAFRRAAAVVAISRTEAYSKKRAAKLGKAVADGDRTFAMAMDEAKVTLATMRERLAELKAAGSDPNKAAVAKAAAGTARDGTIAKLEEAMKLAGIPKPLAADPAADDALQDASIDEINHARYLLTYLLYDGQRFAESASLGRLLVERYPNAKGARHAAKIAMASLQQAAQKAEGDARSNAWKQAADLAGIVMRVWPDAAVSADAAVLAISAAVAARDPAAIVSIIGQVPDASPRRGEVLFRAGTALWRDVEEARRGDEGTRPDDKSIEAWKVAARQSLDEALAGLADATALPAGPMALLIEVGALSRVQIAMDDDDNKKALAVLEHPVYGPWTLVAANDPLVQQGSLAEATLSRALQLFIQAEKFDDAQKAMDGLKKLADQEEASAKLTAMCLSTGRDLQPQLEQLGQCRCRISGCRPHVVGEQRRAKRPRCLPLRQGRARSAVGR